MFNKKCSTIDQVEVEKLKETIASLQGRCIQLAEIAECAIKLADIALDRKEKRNENETFSLLG